MNSSEQDVGILAALLERLETQRLPRALDLQAKVSGGERLDDFDLAFLQEVFADTTQVKPLIDRHPEAQEICAKMIALYHDITAKGLANEKSG